MRWCYRPTERWSHKKGWSEGSNGSGAARAVEDADFEHMCKELKCSGFEYTLDKEDEKIMAKTGKTPKPLKDKMNAAHSVLFFLVNEYT
jgi:hypothetical protein